MSLGVAMAQLAALGVERELAKAHPHPSPTKAPEIPREFPGLSDLRGFILNMIPAVDTRSPLGVDWRVPGYRHSGLQKGQPCAPGSC